MKKALLFKKLPGKMVQCTACLWYCKIPEGQSGICAVRQNKNGVLYLSVYGKAIAANVDPMEKKPLFHFLPGSQIFSIGTLGCNFACSFCQNWDISQASKEVKNRLLKDGKAEQLCTTISQYGLDLSPKKIIDICLERKIPAVAFTYNEPAIFFEYAYDTMKLAKKAGLRTVFVSNGYESVEAISKLKGYLDAINIDLKAFSEEFYQKTCKAKLAPVLENIKKFYKAGVWAEITTLVIPGENDSDEELAKISSFLASISPSIPWHVTRFHPDYKMLDKIETTEDTLLRAYNIGKKAGLKYVYVGNLFDEDHESTYCPKCNALLIHRKWPEIEFVNFKNGRCTKCGTRAEGVWT